jgi:hypothetical protein
MALTTDVSFRLLATLTKAADISSTPEATVDFQQRIKLTTGTSAGQADKLFYDARTLAASATEDLDLVGTLTDQFGDLFSPVRIKALAVLAAAGNSNNVIVGAAAATQWAALLGTTGTITLRPGAFFCAVAGEADATGYVCAAGSTDLLKVANSGAGSSVTYSIVVVGASA